MDQIGAFLNTIFKGINPDPNSPRTMKYPYTFGAQIAHFPNKFYWNNNMLFRYYAYAVILCIPVFYKINKLANSPANYVKLAEYREKERKEEEEHKKHLL